jgi:hypothetical protein
MAGHYEGESMTYNLTNFTSANNFLEIMKASNGLVDGLLVNFMIVMVYLIVFVGLKSYAAVDSFLTTCFVGFLLTSILWGVGVASATAMQVTLVLLIVAIVVHVNTT